ncbi:unnamed protein product [Nezara viridula]|uniref:Uncharacterized protein n=1 Tax=Nezara viridula TaxID=85310 RepID=A0A9P0MU20_NEZVI|nr:unnamed protein product [Nezara viridula]
MGIFSPTDGQFVRRVHFLSESNPIGRARRIGVVGTYPRPVNKSQSVGQLSGSVPSLSVLMSSGSTSVFEDSPHLRPFLGVFCNGRHYLRGMLVALCGEKIPTH